MGKFFTTPIKNGEIFSADELSEALKLFAAKGWYNPDNSNFSQFCKMLKPLSKVQRAMLVELSHNFIKLDNNDLQRRIFESFFAVANLIPEQTSRIIILPLKKIANSGQTKSCDTIYNFLRSPDFKNRCRQTIPSTEIKFVPAIEALKRIQPAASKPDLIIFVDDFLGSGKTAERCVTEAIGICSSLSKNNFYIITILAQINGIKFLEGESIKISYSMKQGRGITDAYTGSDLASKILLMEQIETSLKTKKGYQFGYDRSEALASLVTTPNNTFPIFWQDQPPRHIAPFPRF